MNYLRKNAINFLLFILWLGMSVSLTAAHAGVQDRQAVERAGTG